MDLTQDQVNWLNAAEDKGILTEEQSQWLRAARDKGIIPAVGKPDPVSAETKSVTPRAEPPQDPGSATLEAFDEGFSNEHRFLGEMGLDQSTIDRMRAKGRFPDLEKGRLSQPLLSLNEGLTRGTAFLGEGFLRGIDSLTRIPGNLAKNFELRTGGSQGEARRAERDVDAFTDIGSMVMGAPGAPAKIARLGSYRSPQTGRMGRSAANMRRRISDMEKAGVKPSLPTATDSRSMRLTAQALRNIPVAGDIVDNSVKEGVDALRQARNRSAPLSRRIGRDLAGGEASVGITKWMDKGLQKEANKAYKKFDDLMPQGSDTPLDPITELPNLRRKIAELTAKREARGLKGSGLVGETDDEIQALLSGEINYTTGMLRDLRSRIGSNPSVAQAKTGEKPLKTKDVRGLFAAISKDVGNVAKAKGGPEALKAMKDADKQYQSMMKTVQRLQKIVGKQGDNEGTDVFNKLHSIMTEGGFKRKRLKNAMSTMGKNGRDYMRTGVIQQMGRAVKDDEEYFSVSKFISSYNNLDDAAKDMMFTQGSEMRRSLDRIYRISRDFKELEKMQNNSLSTGHLVYTVMALGLAGITKAIAAVGGGAVAAKMMTSPRVTKQFANMLEKGEAVSRATRQAGIAGPRVTAQYARAANALRGAMSQNPELQEFADPLFEELTRQEPGNAQAQ